MGKGLYKAIRGMKDMLPEEWPLWQYIESTCLNNAKRYGYQLIRTPMVEEKALFVRSVGEQTDVVTKEMYSFDDRNGQVCVLRPEGTAACVRAGIEHDLFYKQVRRLCYLGPMFRRERPQKGRYRQFHTFGAEAFGVDSAMQDVELILLGQSIFNGLGLADKIVCHINCLGDKQTQQDFAKALQAYFQPHAAELGEQVIERLQKNPLRVCDSKDPKIIALLEQGPKITDFLSAESKAHFDEVIALLDHFKVPYQVTPQLVRGLDYYSQVVFEWIATGLGAQSAVGGGGRYNELVESLGGEPTAAAGFGLGLERLLLLMPEVEVAAQADVYCVVLNKDQQNEAMILMEQLRHQLGLSVIIDHTLSSKKAQFKKAEQSAAPYWIITNGSNNYIVKDQISRETLDLTTDNLMQWFENIV